MFTRRLASYIAAAYLPRPFRHLHFIMRILLLNHSPLAGTPCGLAAARLAAALVANGHEVRAIVIDEHNAGAAEPASAPCSTRRIAAGAATARLNFRLPWFEASEAAVFDRLPLASAAGGARPLTYSELTDRQVAHYRDVLRGELDAEISSFNPDLVHAQHAWLWAELALESGAPYVVTVHGPELAAYQQDARYRDLADQAVENAGRLFVPPGEVQEAMRRMFEFLPDRCVNLPAKILQITENPSSAIPSPAESKALAEFFVPHYHEVLRQRFGPAA